MAGNSHIRRLTHYDTRRPVPVDVEDALLPGAEREPEAPPERLLALSVIWQAVSDLQQYRLGAPVTEDHYSAAAFLTGREEYLPTLMFWCQVAHVDAEAVTARAWRQMRPRLASALRYGPPAVRKRGPKSRTVAHV
jgi:hypothetical protein